MVKWTEVSAYSGMPVKEDAPTNFAGAGSKVAMPPDAMMKKKKKKTFLDARTKEYKEHQKRLEAARQRREERRKQAAKINEGQLDEREKGIDKLPRQFLNPDKEVMILKKGRVIVIDKKDQDKYMRQGWELAEEEMMEVNVTFIKKFAADMKKDKQFKPYADKFMKLAMKGGSPRDALEKSVPDFISGKDIEKLISKNRMSAVFGEGTYHIAKDMSKLKKKMQSKMRYDATNFKVAIRHIGDDQMIDELQKLKPNEDMRPIIKKAMQRLGIKEEKTFTQKVQEQIGGFAREAFLAENNMDVIKSIVKSKGAKDIKMKDGKLKMDAFTASAIAQVYDKVNPANKKKMEALANGKKSDLMKLQALAMKFVK
jgi:hypothetical protein